MMRFTLRSFAALVFVAATLTAASITIPQSALIPTNQLYSQQFGVGFGNALVMTGGGNAANVGQSPNDDGFSGPIPLGFTLNFFGNNYTEFWANNNGNISFGGGIASFTPTGPTGAAQPLISPFFADVDTRGAGSGLMSLNTSIANQIIVTWPGVGYYNSHTDKLDTFQLVVRGPGYTIPAGEGQIGFFWTTMGWETGDASGGSGGFGGTPGAVGFGDGAGNQQILQGSTTAGISGVVQNHELWFNLSAGGVPEVIGGGEIPEPGTLALMLGGLLGLGAYTRRRRSA